MLTSSKMILKLWKISKLPSFWGEIASRPAFLDFLTATAHNNQLHAHDYYQPHDYDLPLLVMIMT